MRQPPLRLTLQTATLMAAGLVLAAGLGGAWLGYAEDLDSLGIGQTLEVIQAGGYQRSRVLGTPLYEFTAAALEAVGGLVLVNLGSLAMSMGAVLLLGATLKRAPGKGAAFAVIAAGCSPLMLINASAMMETAMLALWVSAALWAATKAADDRGQAPTVLAALFSALGAATRPDAALFALAVGCALALEHRANRQKALATLAWFAGFGLCAVALYGLLNGGFGFVAEADVTQDEAGRSLARAVFGAAAVLGLFGAVVVAVTLFRVARDPQDAWLRVRRTTPAHRVVLTIAVLAGALYGVRFLALPDELEYLLPALLSLCVAFGALAGRNACAALAACLVLANGVQVGLFERTAEGVRPSISLQPGALAQDWAARRHNIWLRAPETKAELAALVGAPGTQPETLHFWLNGVAFPGGRVVLGEDQLYRFLDVAGPPNPHWLGFYQSVTVCPTPIVLRRGWRVLQPLPRGLGGPPGWNTACQTLNPRGLERLPTPQASPDGEASAGGG
jgi:hypothetical protein